MVEVTLFGSLAAAIEEKSPLEVEAKNIRELLDQLKTQHPALGPQIERGVSVSINGRIYTDSWFQEIPDGAEVVILPMLRGG